MILDRDIETNLNIPVNASLVEDKASSSIRRSCIIYNLRVLLAYCGSAFGMVIFFLWDNLVSDDNDVIRYLYLTCSILGLVIYHSGGCVLSIQVFAAVQDEDETRYFCFCLPWSLSKFITPIQTDTGGDYGHGQADPKIWHQHAVVTISLLTSITDLSTHIPFLILNIYVVIKEDVSILNHDIFYIFLIYNLLSLLYHVVFLVQYLCCKMTAVASNGDVVTLQGLYRFHPGTSVEPGSPRGYRSGADSPITSHKKLKSRSQRNSSFSDSGHILTQHVNFSYSDIPDPLVPPTPPQTNTTLGASLTVMREGEETDALVPHQT